MDPSACHAAPAANAAGAQAERHLGPGGVAFDLLGRVQKVVADSDDVRERGLGNDAVAGPVMVLGVVAFARSTATSGYSDIAIGTASSSGSVAIQLRFPTSPAT